MARSPFDILATGKIAAVVTTILVLLELRELATNDAVKVNVYVVDALMIDAGMINVEVRVEVGNNATSAALVDGDTLQPNVVPNAAAAADKHAGAVAVTDN